MSRLYCCKGAPSPHPPPQPKPPFTWLNPRHLTLAQRPQPPMSSSPLPKPHVSSFPNNIELFEVWLKTRADLIAARVSFPPLSPPQSKPLFTWLNPQHFDYSTEFPTSNAIISSAETSLSYFPNNIGFEVWLKVRADPIDLRVPFPPLPPPQPKPPLHGVIRDI